MRRILLGLGGGAAPIAAAVAVVAMLAGTLALVEWQSPAPQQRGHGLELAELPGSPRATRTARTSLPDDTPAPARRGSPPAQRPAPGDGPADQTQVSPPAQPVGGSGDGGGRPVADDGAPGGGDPTGGQGGGGTSGEETGGPGGGEPSPPTGDPGAPRNAPLAGLGTIVGVAAENATEAIGMTADQLAAGLGTAVPALREPLTGVTGATREILTAAGRALGTIVRNVTGAPPRR